LGTKNSNALDIDSRRGGSARASIDGFVSVKRAANPPHSPLHHVAAHKPAPSKTLMRSAVKKPRIQSPAQIKAQSRTDILTRVPKQSITPKVSYGAIHPNRYKKATQMIKNPAVSHYGSVTDPAKSVFTHQPAQLAAHKPASPVHSVTHHMPVAPVREHHVKPDMFQQALARATSHEQKFDDRNLEKRPASHVAVLLSVLTCLLLAAGALAYLNIPSISLRVASSRAGFQAKLPNYSPVGYSFGNLSYGPGNVTLIYNQDASHKFDITQRTSQWDSQALLTNFVSSANKAYQTYERAGRTIYFFGNNTATWVDNGVWYTVNGNNSLSKNQLLDLASSI
jgi:hypothetical protein